MALNIPMCGLMQIGFVKNPDSPPAVIANGETVPLVTFMILLGVTSVPSLHLDTNINNMSIKAILVVLRRAGISSEHLLNSYTTFIRPGLEYAVPARHPGLTKQLSYNIEKVQSCSLRVL